MKIKFAATTIALLFCLACTFARGEVMKDIGPSLVTLAPDLTVSGVIWRNKPSTAVIIVENIGTAKSAATTGGFRCKGAPDKNGYSVTFGVQFYISELSPAGRRKITLDCKSAALLDVVLDGEKKVAESNESNNEMSFAVAQKKSGPIKKLGQ